MIYADYHAIPRLKYDFIMADPPWHFRQFSAKGYRKNAGNHYGLMSMDAIKEMRVADLCRPDAILWLWATNPMLPQAFSVLEAWGFQFKTAGHWVKRTRHGKLAFGTGYVLRSAGEPFLIGTIGKPKAARNVRSVVEAKVREHSRKPDEAYAAAEAMMPHALSRLDMFSREERPGWDAFGDEVGAMKGED